MLGRERKSLRCEAVVAIDLIGNTDAGNVRTERAQLIVPGHEVRIGHLARDVKDQNARMRSAGSGENRR